MRPIQGCQRALRGMLDRRAVRHGIGEGHAEFDHVGAGFGQTFEDGEGILKIGIARRDEGDESGAALRFQIVEAFFKARHSFTPRCSATEKMSLSPRPLKFTTMRWSRGRSGATRAT